jgi:hypothetical protein
VSGVRTTINTGIARAEYRQCAADVACYAQCLSIGEPVADIKVQGGEIAVHSYGTLRFG